MIGGLDVTTFRDGEERHDVRIRLEEGERASLDDIGQLWVRTRGGELVDLRNLVRIERSATASSITRTDRVRSVELMATSTASRSRRRSSGPSAWRSRSCRPP